MRRNAHWRYCLLWHSEGTLRLGSVTRTGLGVLPHLDNKGSAANRAAVARTEGRPHGAGGPWQERRHGTPAELQHPV